MITQTSSYWTKAEREAMRLFSQPTREGEIEVVISKREAKSILATVDALETELQRVCDEISKQIGGKPIRNHLLAALEAK